MGFEGWLTLAALGVMFIALVREWLSPDVTLFSTMVFLWLCGVITTSEATVGFSSPQVLTVGVLFIVAGAMKDTGALSWFKRLLGGGESTSQTLWRLLWPTAAVSAFMNNTPIVAMLTPEIRAWAQAHSLPTSRFLIPLSYAAILGGTCTLIGTSTNLLVSGLLEQEGLEPFSMFELASVGVPATIVGILYLALVGHRLIPDREAPDDQLQHGEPEFSVRLEVGQDSDLVGKSVEEARLRHLEGLFLVEIDRSGRRIVPVKPSHVLEAGDQLVLFGIVSTVTQLLGRPGLSPVSDDEQGLSEGREEGLVIHEIVIPQRSSFLGQNLRDVRFRRRYDAAVVAIHRGGHRLLQKLGDVELRPGDTLLVLAAKGFRDTWAGSRDFILLSPREASGERGLLALVILVGMVVLMASGATTTFKAAAAAAVLLVVTRCIRAARARTSIDLSVLVVMASAFGLSAAVENSGLAGLLAGGALSMFGVYGPVVALAMTYLLCAGVTETLSNAAAAAIVFPIAITLAHELGVDPRAFGVAVAIAASMSFVTPLGYQTNLLVYGPGGYRFGDFTRVGLPLALLCFAVAMVCIPWRYGL